MSHMMRVLLMVVGLSAVSHPVCAACKLTQLAEFPVTMSNIGPLVDATINGADARFVVDRGSGLNVMSPAAAAEFKLSLQPPPANLVVNGVNGSVDISLATINTLTIAKIPLGRVAFIVGGTDPGEGAAGYVGQSLLRTADDEFDLANGVIRLVRPDGCGKAALAYWMPSGPYSMMEIYETSPMAPATEGAVGKEPVDAAGYSQRGMAYAARRDFDHALADLTRACELAPQQPAYFYQRGVARRDSKQPQLAMADFDQAILLDTQNTDALAWRCFARTLTRQELNKAMDDCNAAIRLNSKAAFALQSRALVWMRLGDLNKSMAHYDRALQLQPQDAWTLYGRGVDKSLEGLSGDAKADMDAAIALQPLIVQEAAVLGVVP